MYEFVQVSNEMIGTLPRREKKLIKLNLILDIKTLFIQLMRGIAKISSIFNEIGSIECSILRRKIRS